MPRTDAYMDPHQANAVAGPAPRSPRSKSRPSRGPPPPGLAAPPHAHPRSPGRGYFPAQSIRTYDSHKRTKRTSFPASLGSVKRSLPSFSKPARLGVRQTDSLEAEEEDGGLSSGGLSASSDSELWTDEEELAFDVHAGQGETTALDAHTSAVLRSFKQSPMVTHPGTDYTAFEETYLAGLNRSKYLFAFLSEEMPAAMVPHVEAIEDRQLKSIALIEKEKEKLVGPEGVARQNKANDLITRLSSLSSQVLANRQSCSNDLQAIRDEAADKMSTLQAKYDQASAALDKQLKQATSGGGGGAGKKGGKGGGKKR
ncbi:hypothetical protein JCM10207_000968 [Rhodosporidiobolus poonsookiae]